MEIAELGSEVIDAASDLLKRFDDLDEPMLQSNRDNCEGWSLRSLQEVMSLRAVRPL